MIHRLCNPFFHLNTREIMRRILYPMALLATIVVPIAARAQTDEQTQPDTYKEYAVKFDKWGIVHCVDEGKACTAP